MDTIAAPCAWPGNKIDTARAWAFMRWVLGRAEGGGNPNRGAYGRSSVSIHLKTGRQSVAKRRVFDVSCVVSFLTCARRVLELTCHVTAHIRTNCLIDS